MLTDYITTLYPKTKSYKPGAQDDNLDYRN